MAEAGTVRADGSPAGDGITVYGANWCGDTRRSCALLDGLGVRYAFVDVDHNEAASTWAAEQNGGQRRIPVVVHGRGGQILVEPSDDELAGALDEVGSGTERGEAAGGWIGAGRDIQDPRRRPYGDGLLPPDAGDALPA